MHDRYRATPSRLEPSSWNVLDTHQFNAWGEVYVTVPLVTRHAAQQCAQCLNQGRAAYAWLARPPRPGDAPCS